MKKNLNKFYVEMAYLRSENEMFGLSIPNIKERLERILDTIIGKDIPLPEAYIKLINGLVYFHGDGRILVKHNRYDEEYWLLKWDKTTIPSQEELSRLKKLI